jgi:molecular chaperone DnaK (HSP70)
MKKSKQTTKPRLGIDFGTTRTVVARVEGGNYPLVTFEAEWGDGQEWYPSLIAGKGSKRVFWMGSLVQTVGRRLAPNPM